MCQTHLFTYWVRKAEQNRAPDKLQSAGTQMYGREGGAWKSSKDCVTQQREEPKSMDD